MKQIKLLAVTGLAGLTATVALGSVGLGSANADPTPAGFRVLAGVGSDTTQDVVNALGEAITLADGSKPIASYDATGGGSITTKSSAGCTFARPVGSGAGRTALLKALNPSDPTFGCLNFSRSSSLNLAPTDPGLTYVPFALDAVSYAVTSTSAIPKDLTKARLTAIYQCQDPTVPAPLLPQAGSGTRAFWLAQLGLTETTKGACVVDQKNAQSIIENDGSFVTGSTDIIPFSVASFIAQSNGVSKDTRGTAVLGNVDGVSPTTGSPAVLNPAFGIKRSVYNVIPTSKIAVSPTSDVFVGSSSKVCQQAAIIQKFGFGLSPQCGDTSNRTATTTPTAGASVFTRLAGNNRYATAAAAATDAFKGGSANVVLASGENFPDALSGNFLAGFKKGASLLTAKAALSPEAKSALATLGAKTVYILGGTGAVSAAVETELTSAQYTVVRVAGANRFETSQKISEFAGSAAGTGPGTAGKTAILSNGQNYADALAAGPMAYAKQYPVVLTNPTTLSPEASSTLKDDAIKNVIIVGGTSAVSQGIEDALKAQGYTITRLAGTSRTGTAVKIANYETSSEGFSKAAVDLARSENFADALAGGPNAGSELSPIITAVNPNTLGSDAADYLIANNTTLINGDIYGGTGAISQAVEDEASKDAKGTRP